nr:uncharacterized protein LOC103345676 [Oryctolagus cuniculus]
MLLLLTLPLLAGSACSAQEMQGPGGGSYFYIQDGGQGEIQGIRVFVGLLGLIKGVQLRFGTHWSARYGAPGGHAREFLLQAGEHVTAVDGSALACIRHLRWTTSRGREATFGRPAGRRFSSRAPAPGQQLLTTNGQHRLLCLSGIGFKWGFAPERASTPASTVAFTQVSTLSTVAPTPLSTPAPTSASIPASTVAPTSASTLLSTVAPTSASTLLSTVAPTSASTLQSTVAPTSASTLQSTLAPTLVSTLAPTSASTLWSTAAPNPAPTSASTLPSTMALDPVPTPSSTLSNLSPTSAATLPPNLAPNPVPVPSGLPLNCPFQCPPGHPPRELPTGSLGAP